jgi:hypothetical protein
MGIVDKKSYTLKCPNCQKVEKGLVVDKGSTWNGSSWSNRCNFQFFNVQWSDSDSMEPNIVNASCVECGSAADVDYSYSL